MSWRTKFTGFIVMAIVLGVFCIGQVYARPDYSMDGPSVKAIGNIQACNGFWGLFIMGHKAPPGNIAPMPTMRPIPTLKPIPRHNVSAQIQQGYTDKKAYNAGDTAHGIVVLKNTGDTVINDVTVNVLVYKSLPLIGYVSMGSKSVTLKSLDITPGMVKKLDQDVKIPNKYKGFRTSGDYKLEVTLSTNGTSIGSFTSYFNVK
jgi:hypothetical protein